MKRESRAYSLLNVREIVERDDAYVVQGLASTPAPDRMGDVVEPMGAKFALPMPLLWQHNAEKPVGHVTFAKPNKDGIPFTAEIPKVREAGVLKDRIDEAIQSLKYRLVAAVSIGFRALEDGYELMKTGGIRWTSWEWMELSLVTIPANSEATISAVKSLARAASGISRRSIQLLPPGVPGATQTPKGKPDMTTQEMIAALEAKRAAAAARREAIQKAAMDGGRAKDEAEKEEFDGLTVELKTIDEELVDLRMLAADEVKSAKPAPGAEAPRAPAASAPQHRHVTVHANVEPGIALARVGMAQIRARQNNSTAADEFRRVKAWMDQTPQGLELIQRTAVLAGDTTTSGWASQLAYAQDAVADFVEFLRPKTVIGKLGLRSVPFNIRFGTQTAGVSGSWVGQGKPVPVGKPTFSSGSLGIAKASVITAIDEELAKLSSPSAEMLVRDDMAKGVQEYLDRQFLDPTVAASANVSPASITNGVTKTTPSGTNAAAVRTDIATLLTALSRTDMDLGSLKLIMAPETAMQIGLMVTSLGVLQFPNLGLDGGSLLGIPVVTSNCANISGSPESGRMIIAAVCSEIMLADEGGMAIDVSNQTALQLDDAPTNASAGSVAATSLVSMYQTHTLALRCTRWINWGKRRSNCVEFIQDAAYVA